MKQTATAEDYAAAFEKERQNTYPLIDAFEQRMGYAIDRERLEAAARVLACPVKKNAPNWQHGRVLYSAARKFLEGKPPGCWTFFEIGSAKGFASLCLQWALNDHAGGAWTGEVVSVDVIDPQSAERRNTVAEVDGYKTLAETLSPWPEASLIRFVKSTGIDWLRANVAHLDFVFVDGKHSARVVADEAVLIAARQQPGDICVFDDVDVQRPDMRAVVRGLHHSYRLEWLDILPNRGYAVGVRK